MYFANIPKIIYDSENNEKFKVVTNLLRRVKIRAKVKENTVLLDTYDVKDGEVGASPTEIHMTLNFQEMDIITHDDVVEGY